MPGSVKIQLGSNRDLVGVQSGSSLFSRVCLMAYGPVSQLSRSEKCCTGPFNWGEAHCAGENVKRKIGLFQRKSADAVAKRYRPWPKGLRADSLPWFDSPLVQGASRLRYTDKAQMQRPGHTGRKALATKKKDYSSGSLYEPKRNKNTTKGRSPPRQPGTPRPGSQVHGPKKPTTTKRDFKDKSWYALTYKEVP